MKLVKYACGVRDKQNSSTISIYLPVYQVVSTTLASVAMYMLRIQYKISSIYIKKWKKKEIKSIIYFVYPSYSKYYHFNM